MAYYVAILQFFVAKLPLLAVIFIILNFVRKYFTIGLRQVPGPFLARFSNLWKLNAAWHQDMPKRNIAIHQKYGSVVRIGHNTVSVSDPSALAVIYNFKAWDKVGHQLPNNILQ